MPTVLFTAFECQNAGALQIMCGKDCFNIYDGNTREECAWVIFDAVFRGYELAVGLFIKLWPDSLGSALAGAAAGGSVANARLLIEHGADINVTGPEDTFNGSMEWNRMRKEVAPGQADQLQLTPLACAAAKGHLEMAQLLVKHGATIDVHAGTGNTPLCWAASQGKHEVLDYILSAYSAEDVRNPALKALEAAGNRDQSESIILLWNFLDPKPEPSPDNATWLLRAATVCQDRMLLSELFENGFGDIYQTHPPPLEDSAISAAIEKHDLVIFKLLLERLAYDDQTLPDLLFIAIKQKNEDIVSHLLGRVDIAQLDPRILVHAAPCEPIFKELISAGVNQAELAPHTQQWIAGGLVHVVGTLLSNSGFLLEDHINQPILHCALRGGKRMFEFLLEQHRWDDQLSAHGSDADGAIEWAVANGHLDLLQVLFEQHFPYVSEHELLVLAVLAIENSTTRSQTIDFLLQRNSRALRDLDSDGYSVLFRLMTPYCLEVCKDAMWQLLDRGADPLQRNQSGGTPLEEAAKNIRFTPFRTMAEYLEQRDDWHVIGPYVDRQDQILKENIRKYIVEPVRCANRAELDLVHIL
ncbi:ankyrin repeat-containing domain protein [Aspergillus terricola var. indicus]